MKRVAGLFIIGFVGWVALTLYELEFRRAGPELLAERVYPTSGEHPGEDLLNALAAAGPRDRAAQRHATRVHLL